MTVRSVQPTASKSSPDIDCQTLSHHASDMQTQNEYRPPQPQMNVAASKEDIDNFFAGTNPLEKAIKIEADYKSTQVEVYYRNEEGKKVSRFYNFYPFVWCKATSAAKLFKGDRRLIKEQLAAYGIGCCGLRTTSDDGAEHPRLRDGYRILFYARIPMSFSHFQDFFTAGGRPIYPKKGDLNEGLKEYICVSPNEQFMIETGIRLFKGYHDYNDLLRLIYDLETTGLTPSQDMIDQLGIRTNKGFEKIITVGGEGQEKFDNELGSIDEFYRIVAEINPDISTGHNVENFDRNFIDVRAQVHGTTMGDISKKYLGSPVYKKKKDQVLKLGGEVEYFKPTVARGINLTDSWFAVRRAMAIDSNMKSAGLKYVTRYAKIQKPNRVYVPGKYIGATWRDMSKSYAFNDTDGEWFHVTTETLNKTYSVDDVEHKRYTYDESAGTLTNNETGKVFQMVTGRYIVERYLLDDLWEGDKVEARYNATNFLVCKLLPVSFEKACTMGTAAIWKYIMLSWSFEHGLGIPDLIEKTKFTGGLSRLLQVGYADRIVKLDYNSLYPSIILSYGISTPIDISNAMSNMLEFVLTQREYYKGKKAEAGKRSSQLKEQIKACTDPEEKARLQALQFQADSDKQRADNQQLQLKVLGNSFFGSYSAGKLFPWSDMICGERTTCTGRMCLRLMIKHFSNIASFPIQGDDTPVEERIQKYESYKPIVGDSFTGDTPFFIRKEDKITGQYFIDIRPVAALMNDAEAETDALGRTYDYSEKEYEVLCRSGWMKPSYIYRHGTNKTIYEVSDDSNDMSVEVTEDHSLFNAEQKKLKPSEITESTELEYFDGKEIFSTFNTRMLTYAEIRRIVFWFNHCDKKVTRIPLALLNAEIDLKQRFLSNIDKSLANLGHCSKTALAGIQFLQNCVNAASCGC